MANIAVIHSPSFATDKNGDELQLAFMIPLGVDCFCVVLVRLVSGCHLLAAVEDRDCHPGLVWAGEWRGARGEGWIGVALELSATRW